MNSPNMIYSIYTIQHRFSNKAYIGFTSMTPKERFDLHVKDAIRGNTNCYIHHAISKHGREAFEVGAIYQSKDVDHTLEIMEPWFISEYRKAGVTLYNIQDGGRGYKNNPRSKPVELYDFDLNLIKTLPSQSAVARHLGCNLSTVIQACRQAEAGKGSKIKEVWVCFQGSKPVKKDTSYMAERNRTHTPHLGKKRPDHSEWMKRNNPRSLSNNVAKTPSVDS